MEWAIQQGESAHPDWYPKGSTESAVDVQCSLFLMTQDDVVGNGHNCTLPPCAAISESMTESGGSKVDACSPPIVHETEQGPSMDWWGWVLIVAAVLALAAGIAFAMGYFGGSRKPKSKKRSIKPIPAATEPPAEVPVAVAPVVTAIAPPVYFQAPVYEATQSIAVAAPQVVTGSSVYAPVTSVVAAPAASMVATPVSNMVVPGSYQLASPVQTFTPVMTNNVALQYP